MLIVVILLGLLLAVTGGALVLSSGAALKQKYRADRYALAANMLYDLLGVDEKGNTIARGPGQYMPAVMALRAAQAQDDTDLAPDPPTFKTASFDLVVPIEVR